VHENPADPPEQPTTLLSAEHESWVVVTVQPAEAVAAKKSTLQMAKRRLILLRLSAAQPG
jgi:hypothetical protein